MAEKQLIGLNVTLPYDFRLSRRVVKAFDVAIPESDDHLRLTTLIDERMVTMEIRPQGPQNQEWQVVFDSGLPIEPLRRIAEWVLSADLDLKPFYARIGADPRLKPLVEKLYGLKAFRPLSLFEMAVTAVTEQQISLAAANRIRARLVQKFGQKIGGQPLFPIPETLAAAPLEALQTAGYSLQKTRYIHELALKVSRAEIDLEKLKSMTDQSARDVITDWYGFGRWSADYILVRGLARPDALPEGDLAIRTAVGRFLGTGSRLSPAEVLSLMEPFRPFRGLLAFYLLAAGKLGLVYDAG